MKFLHRHKWERVEFDDDSKTGDIVITNQCVKCGKKDVEFYFKGDENDDI